jgi:hypothetical protein
MPVDVSVVQSSDDGAWWTLIVLTNESTSGVHSDEIARSLTAAGEAVLDRLRSAPLFRFAVIGVEAQEAIALADFDQRSAPIPRSRSASTAWSFPMRSTSGSGRPRTSSRSRPATDGSRTGGSATARPTSLDSSSRVVGGRGGRLVG